MLLLQKAEHARHFGRGDGRVGHKAVGVKAQWYPVGDPPQDGAHLSFDQGLVVDKFPRLNLPLNVGGDEGILVRRFTWTLRGSNTMSEIF